MKKTFKKIIMTSVSMILVIAAVYYISPRQTEAAVTFHGAGTMGTATGTTDPTAALPASTAANDIILVHCVTRDTTNTTVVSGYTEIAQLDTANADHRWFWKRHSGSESNPVCNRDISADSWGKAYVFRGARTSGNPWNVLGTPEQHTTEPMSVAAISPTIANTMIVVMDSYADNNTASAVTSATDPSTFTDVYEESATGDDMSMHIGYAVKSGAGSTGTITIDYDKQFTAGDQSGVLALALEPLNVPTVTTQAASDITTTTATGNGTITDTGGGVVSIRGFVYDTSSKSLPGNVAPASSGYAYSASDSGSFTTGAYTKGLVSLSSGVTYYMRSYAYNSAGYSYGNEVSFTTVSSQTLSGTVYQSEGGSNIGSGKTVAVYKNGSTLVGSNATNASGGWSVSGTISSGDIINAYIDNDTTYKGNTVFVSDGSGKSDIHIYGGVLAVRHDSGSNITNTNLSTGRVSGDPNDMMYTISGSNLTATSSAEIHIWTGDTYAPGGTVKTKGSTGHLHLDDNSGATLATVDNAITGNITIDSGATLTISNDTKLSGSLTNNGTFTHSANTLELVDSTIMSTISSVSDISFSTLKSSAGGKTIRFQKQTAGSPKFTITGSFNFQGIYGNPIKITSDTPGTQWHVYFNSNQSNVNNIRLTDSGCAAGTYSVNKNASIIDGGNNGSCWGLVDPDAPPPVGESNDGWGSLKTGGSKKNPAEPTGQNATGGGSTQTGGSVAPPTGAIP